MAHKESSRDLHQILSGFDFIGPSETDRGTAPFPNIALFGVSGVGKGRMAHELCLKIGSTVPGFGDYMRKAKASNANTFSNDPDIAQTIKQAHELMISECGGRSTVWEGHLAVYPDTGRPQLVTTHLSVLHPRAVVFVTADPAEIFAGQIARYEGSDAELDETKQHTISPSAGRRLQYSSADEVAERQQRQYDACRTICDAWATPCVTIDNSRSLALNDITDELAAIIHHYLPDYASH